jgi:hypothetical protein
MKLSSKDWSRFISLLRTLSDSAYKEFNTAVIKNGWNSIAYMDGPQTEMLNYAYALVTKYGEATASLSALMYDQVAESEGAIVPPAVPAETANYGAVAKAIKGAQKFSQNADYISNVVGRMVKQAGADTTLQNALRDGSQFAWIPSGDTCAFCITLASRGWQYASKDTIKNCHAEHIHSNCDCNYSVRFDNKSTVAGYDPDKYLEMYQSADGSTPQQKINSLRRMEYQENKEKINEQKRIAYKKRAEASEE